MGRLIRVVLVAALLAGGVGATLFGARLYRTWEIARSAEAAGVPDTAGIRAWMTIGYVAATYDVPTDSLAEQLDVPAEMANRITLRGLARQRGQSPLAIIAETQRAIASLRGTDRAVPVSRRLTEGGARSTG
jgi:uncharacterized SAM-binding protein YcdF (DUF218 family)